MESYGIHAAQLQGNAETASNHDFINQVRSHNQQVMSNYKSAKEKADSAGDISGGEYGGLSTYQSLSGVHAAYQSYQQMKNYGGGLKGAGRAITAGAGANLYDLSGGRFGKVPMGPMEAKARARTTDDPVYNRRTQLAVEGTGADGELKAGATADQRAAVGYRTAQRGLDATPAGVSHSAQQIAFGQAQDKASGAVDSSRAANPIDKTTAEIRAAATTEGDKGLGFEGKIMKKGITMATGSEAIGHTIGALAPVGQDIAGMAYGAYDIAENWKKDNTAQKTGAVLGEVGGALDMIGTAVPVLAPLGLAVDAASAISDLIGGVEKDKDAVSAAAGARDAGLQTAPKQADNSVQSSTTTQTAPTSLQKLSGGSTSSY